MPSYIVRSIKFRSKSDVVKTASLALKPAVQGYIFANNLAANRKKPMRIQREVRKSYWKQFPKSPIKHQTIRYSLAINAGSLINLIVQLQTIPSQNSLWKRQEQTKVHTSETLFSFPLGGGHGGSSPRRIRNTSQSTAISDNSAGPTPTRDQARSEIKLGYLGSFPVGVANRTRLADLSWAFSTRGQTIVTGICLFEDVVLHWGLYEFHSYALSRSITPWTLRKILSLPLVFEIALFKSVMAIGEDRNEDRFKTLQLCGVRKLPFCDRKAIKLTQNCAANTHVIN